MALGDIDTDRADEILRGLKGRVRDSDSHEVFPARLWVSEYGAHIAPIAEFYLRTQPTHVPNSVSVDHTEDTAPIKADELDSYWTLGCRAPGAFDMKRRIEFMDLTGVAESFVFGTTVCFVGQKLASVGGASVERQFGGQFGFDRREMGLALLKAHNDWCARAAQVSPRVRPVPFVLTESLDEALAQSRALHAAGLRAVQLPACLSVGGKAPAHPDNDALWQFYADHDMAVLLHAGSEPALLREHDAWYDAPQFAAKESYPTELQIDPYSLAILSLGAQNFVANMVLGGVFERVPNLRFGVMEMGAQWIGPLAENMDVWAKHFSRRLSGVLSAPPSAYVGRNIRVSPFIYEPVEKYIERQDVLRDVLCFSSDYPHFEGGKNPVRDYAERLAHLGPDVSENFFVRNAEWVMPGPAARD